MSLEYVSLSNKEYDRISKMIRASYADSCIVEINKITNEAVSENFAKHLSQHPASKVVELFHGTQESRVAGIVSDGFKSTLNRVSVYGVGTYFSPDAKLSYGYTLKDPKENMAYIVLCNVIIGNTCLGPSTDKSFSAYVNMLTNPSIYCVPHDNAILPVYIIQFYKHANLQVR